MDSVVATREDAGVGIGRDLRAGHVNGCTRLWLVAFAQVTQDQVKVAKTSVQYERIQKRGGKKERGCLQKTQDATAVRDQTNKQTMTGPCYP